jgi:Tol biopolymer transport system component
VSNRTGDAEIFVADAKGKQSIQLTDHAGHDYAPAWRPLAEREVAR